MLKKIAFNKNIYEKSAINQACDIFEELQVVNLYEDEINFCIDLHFFKDSKKNEKIIDEFKNLILFLSVNK
ncbi:MAG: hypothetical protein JXB50_15895 [Spirochaetes bacterium]|nr:hypothetical protein [Spirochaetota bacterium]